MGSFGISKHFRKEKLKVCSKWHKLFWTLRKIKEWGGCMGDGRIYFYTCGLCGGYLIGDTGQPLIDPAGAPAKNLRRVNKEEYQRQSTTLGIGEKWIRQ